MIKKISIILVVIIILVFASLAINKWPHKVTFYNAETSKAYSNEFIQVHYRKFCISSPCGYLYRLQTLYSGVSDDAGSVLLWGHSVSDINNQSQGDRIVEYSIIIDGQAFVRADKDRSGGDSMYLIPDDQYDIEFFDEEIEIRFNWIDVSLWPDTNLSIGDVLYTEISPNKQFLYIRTGQGGGFGGIVYDRETYIAHILGGQVEQGEAWDEDGLLHVYDIEYFGENIGEVINSYISRDDESPWVLLEE